MQVKWSKTNIHTIAHQWSQLWAENVQGFIIAWLLFFKFHAEIYFDHDLQSYVLVDQGSQNGTVVNGKQILQVSERVVIASTSLVGLRSWSL